MMRHAPNSVVLKGRCVAPGNARGLALVAPTRLSFWGGFDPVTGTITEIGNPLQGYKVKDRILVFISTKGSSGTSNMLNIARRTGQLPSGFINTEIDCVLALGCLVQQVPLVVDLDQDPFALIKTGDFVRISGDVPGGTATVEVYRQLLLKEGVKK